MKNNKKEYYFFGIVMIGINLLFYVNYLCYIQTFITYELKYTYLGQVLTILAFCLCLSSLLLLTKKTEIGKIYLAISTVIALGYATVQLSYILFGVILPYPDFMIYNYNYYHMIGWMIICSNIMRMISDRRGNRDDC